MLSKEKRQENEAWIINSLTLIRVGGYLTFQNTGEIFTKTADNKILPVDVKSYVEFSRLVGKEFFTSRVERPTELGDFPANFAGIPTPTFIDFIYRELDKQGGGGRGGARKKKANKKRKKMGG